MSEAEENKGYPGAVYFAHGVQPKLIYLACPYTHSHWWKMRQRAQLASQAAGLLKKKGVHVFSPISHGHAIAEQTADLPVDYEYWQAYSRRMLSLCDEVIVLRLDGWEVSVGVRDELEHAAELGKPVQYMDPQRDWLRGIEL